MAATNISFPLLVVVAIALSWACKPRPSEEEVRKVEREYEEIYNSWGIEPNLEPTLLEERTGNFEELRELFESNEIARTLLRCVLNQTREDAGRDVQFEEVNWKSSVTQSTVRFCVVLQIPK